MKLESSRNGTVLPCVKTVNSKTSPPPRGAKDPGRAGGKPDNPEVLPGRLSHEEAEIAVLQNLENHAAGLMHSADPHFSEWAKHWAGRFYRGRIQRNFVRRRRAWRNKHGRHTPFADSYHLEPSEEFTELAFAFGFSPQGLAELLCEAFVRVDPRSIIIGRAGGPPDAGEPSLAEVCDLVLPTVGKGGAR